MFQVEIFCVMLW